MKNETRHRPLKFRHDAPWVSRGLSGKLALILALTAAVGVSRCAGVVEAPEAETKSPTTREFATGQTNALRLHFRGAALETVLEYFAEAAGFSVILEAQPRGRVDVWSDQPVSTSEALELLNSVLIRNDLAAIRDGRTLRVVNRDEIKTRGVPVRLGADPATIPRSAEVATQIIPLRFVEVAQLAKTLAPLVSSQTTMTANESANLLVITDTLATVHRLAEIIQAMDAAAESVTAVRVFRLHNADAQEMTDLLNNLFSSKESANENQSPFQPPDFPPPPFGGPDGGPPDFPGAGAGGSAATPRTKKRTPVTAVADARTASVVVSADPDVMTQVESIVTRLDADPARKRRVMVYTLKNTTGQQAAKVLQDLFQKSGSTSSRNLSTQTDPLQTRSQQSLQTPGNSQAGSGGNSSGGAGPAGGGGAP